MHAAPAGEQRDGGAIYVGDTALTSPSSFVNAPSGKVVALEALPKPLPGQLKPDGNGRCLKGQYAINGGCWLKVELGDLKDCKGVGDGFEYRGSCYAPSFPPTREPTSDPVEPTGPKQ
jgi:hypothetical protein